MPDTICLFCGKDAVWDDGELACLVGGHVALIGVTLEEYEQRVMEYGSEKARERLRDLQACRGVTRSRQPGDGPKDARLEE